jgi:hypothetical protein
MAKQVIGFEATLDGAKVEKSVKSIKTELREAQQEAINLARKFGDTSTEALQAAQKVANLRDEVGDFKNRVDALNPDAKFRAFSQSLQGVAGGFAGLQGAIGLFGTESKDLEKQLLKVQSALALSEGLNAILESKDAFKNLGIVGVQAFNSIKTAIGATGIGLLVVALGTIYAYWDDITEAVSGVSQEQQKLNRETNKNVQAQKDKLAELDNQDAVLKQQGLSERQILKLKEAQTRELIKQQIVQLEGAKAAADAELKRTTDMFATTSKVVSAFAGTAAGLSVAKLLFDPGETAQKGADNIKEIDKQLKESKNRLAEYQNQITEIDIKDAETKKQKREEAKEKQDKLDEEADKKLLDDIKKKADQAAYEKQVEADTIADLAAQDAAALQAENDRLATDGKIKVSIAKATSDELIKNQQAEADAKAAINSAYLDTLGQFGALLGAVAGKNKSVAIAGIVIEQASAIGRIISNTAVANAKAVAASPLTGGMPFVAINKISAGLGIASSIAAGAKAISQIKSAPGGSPDGGGNLPSGGGALPTQAPIASSVQVSQMQSVGTSSVNVTNQSAVKAFVVERDITDSQDRIAKIKSAATF